MSCHHEHRDRVPSPRRLQEDGDWWHHSHETRSDESVLPLHPLADRRELSAIDDSDEADAATTAQHSQLSYTT